MKLLLVTGTPGVGKTITCRYIEKKLEIPYINLNQLVINKNLTSGYDEKRNCYIADFDKISEEVLQVIRALKSEIVILDGHFIVHVVNLKKVNKIFVLRCNPYVLENRLKNRGYSEEKIAENIMAEILGVCFNDVLNCIDSKKICQIDITNLSPFEVANKIIGEYKNKKLKSEEVDWMAKMIEEDDIQLLLKYEKKLSMAS